MKTKKELQKEVKRLTKDIITLIEERDFIKIAEVKLLWRHKITFGEILLRPKRKK